MSKTEQGRCGGALAWRKPSRSVANGACVAAAEAAGSIMVRDTVHPESTQLRFPADAWRAFTAGLKVA